MGIVYCATNRVNGKMYIGKSRDSALTRRRHCHLNSARRKDGFVFHAALLKYGPENFAWKILEHSDDNEVLCDLEREYIDLFSTAISCCGYNLTHGGEGASMATEEAREISRLAHIKAAPKISATLKRKYASGEIISPNKGKKVVYSPETKAHLTAIRKGKPAPNKGIPHTTEALANMSRAHRGRKCPKAKLTPVSCVVCDTVFESNATHKKFCPECKSKYGWRKLNILRKDGYAYVPQHFDYQTVFVLKTDPSVILESPHESAEADKPLKSPKNPDKSLYLRRFRIKCTSCNKPFICGTVTRELCPICTEDKEAVQ